MAKKKAKAASVSETAPIVVRKSEPALVADLRKHPRNYREHPEDQLRHLLASMREHGFYRNVVVAKDRKTILAGHGVVQAALLGGLREVPVVVLDVSPNDPRALKLVAGDNEVANLAESNDRLLTDLLKEVHESIGLVGTGYDESMLANLAFVTRPASEIRDLNEAAEWVGMPDLGEDGEVPIKLVVSFKTEEDRDRFVEEAELTVDKKAGRTWSTRWPFTERLDVSPLTFEEAGEDEGA